jgi:hypothetical protein
MVAREAPVDGAPSDGGAARQETMTGRSAFRYTPHIRLSAWRGRMNCYETKIGHIYTNTSDFERGKFIIAKEGQSLALYAMSLKTVSLHCQIAENYSIEAQRIIGGGQANYTRPDAIFGLIGESADFGAVPLPILEAFLPAIEEHFFTICSPKNVLVREGYIENPMRLNRRLEQLLGEEYTIG